MVVVLILLAAASRLLPHAPNFTPVAALGLFAGATLGRRAAWIVPFAALLLSDLVLGFYVPVSMFFNYLGFAACLALGSALLGKSRTLPRLGAAALSSSVVFFVLSNLGMWVSGYYPRTLAGLGACYAAGLPFLRNTVLSDVLFTAALFGSLALLRRLFPSRPSETVRA